MHAVLIRDHILTAHRGFTDQLARYLDVIGVWMLPGRSKPPSIRAAEVAAAAAIVLRLAELATPRRALPAGRQVDAGATPPPSASAARPTAPGVENGRRVVFLLVRVAGIYFRTPAQPPHAREPRYIDTTAIEVR